MKILVVHNRYIHRGGEDVCVENEIDALSQANITVQPVLVQSGRSWETFWQALQAPRGNRYVNQVDDQLQSAKPDVLHLHNLYPLLSPRLIATAHRLQIPTVLTLHNYRPLCLNGLFLTPSHEICERCADRNYGPGILRGCYRGSRAQSAFMASHLGRAKREGWYEAVSRFIAPSHFLKEKFVEHGFPSERITVQGHFLPQRVDRDPVPAQPYVLYLGRLSQEKGILWLLRFFKENDVPCSLHVAGDGPLKNQVLASQGQKIQYLGHVEGQAKANAIAQASAVVMASECYENFPLAIMEANQYGVPVIAPALGGFTELVTSGVNGTLYPSQSAADLRMALIKILTDDTSSLRQSAQSFARDRFSKKRFLETRLPLYQSLLTKQAIMRP